MTIKDYEAEKEKKLLEMVAASPGTDITDLARQFVQINKEHERVLGDQFKQQQTARPELSDGDIEEIYSRNLETVVGLYKSTEKIMLAHLSLVPALVSCGEKGLAERILKNVLSNDRFDKSQWILFHGRQYKYGDLGDNFVALDDQIALVRALYSLDMSAEAQRTMDSTRRLLVKKGEFRNYFNVLEYVNPSTGKIAECDSWKMGDAQHKEISEYFQGEFIVGNENLVSQLLGGDWIKTYNQPLRYLGLNAVRRYLGLCKTLGVSEDSFIVRSSKKMLEGCYIPEWNLYAAHPWAWYHTAEDRKLPPRGELRSDSQLNVTLLHLLEGELDKAKALLTTTLNADLYRKGRFTGNNPRTDALGIFVLEGIRTPERVGEFVYV